MNRLGLKISCLLISIVIWVQVASHSTVQQSANLPLVIHGLGENLTLEGSQIDSHVNVVLEGSKLRLFLHRFFQRYVGEVRVNLWDKEPGKEFSYEVVPTDVFSDLKVVAIKPKVRLRLTVDKQEFRLLPIVQDQSGQLPKGLAFLETPYLKPDSVLVSGPSRFFKENLKIVAKPIDFSELQKSGNISVPLEQPGEFLYLVTSKVSLDVQIASLSDRTLANIPVVPLVDAGRPAVGVSPPVVDVMVRGVADSVSALTANRFMVTVSVGALEDGIYELPGQIDSPPWLEVIGLDPPSFQVIVGSGASADSSSEDLDSDVFTRPVEGEDD
ncbi:MAG: hypothetical protein GY780_13655 [bacterium]|nr:hypothetical protein [bacterium]